MFKIIVYKKKSYWLAEYKEIQAAGRTEKEAYENLYNYLILNHD